MDGADLRADWIARYRDGAPARAWPRVLHHLRATVDLSSLAADLQRFGLPDEAAWWRGRSDASERGDEAVEAVRNEGAQDGPDRWWTPLDDDYPPLWISRLDDHAPACLRVDGMPPPTPWVGIVGIRDAAPEDLDWAGEAAAAAVGLGAAVVSGGARGVDRAAAAGAAAAGGTAIELLATGLPGPVPAPEGVVRASAWPDGASFSANAAWRRNAWIYAASRAVVVVRAHLGGGGSWGAARDALRRRWAPLIVRADLDDPASRALAALGAVPLSDPAGLGAAVEEAERRFALRADGRLFP